MVESESIRLVVALVSLYFPDSRDHGEPARHRNSGWEAKGDAPPQASRQADLFFVFCRVEALLESHSLRPRPRVGSNG